MDHAKNNKKQNAPRINALKISSKANRIHMNVGQVD